MKLKLIAIFALMIVMMFVAPTMVSAKNSVLVVSGFALVAACVTAIGYTLKSLLNKTEVEKND